MGVVRVAGGDFDIHVRRDGWGTRLSWRARLSSQTTATSVYLNTGPLGYDPISDWNDRKWPRV